MVITLIARPFSLTSITITPSPSVFSLLLFLPRSFERVSKILSVIFVRKIRTLHLSLRRIIRIIRSLYRVKIRFTCNKCNERCRVSTTRKSEFDGHEISRLVTNNLEQRSPSFVITMIKVSEIFLLLLTLVARKE